MAFQTMKDVLDYARAFHKRVKEYYQGLSEGDQQERVKMLLDYLVSHEQNLEQALTRYEKDAKTKLLNTWLQFTPDQRRITDDELKIINTNEPFDEVVRKAIELDDKLIRLYKDVADTTENPAIREVFENLWQEQEKEKELMVRDSVLLSDL